MGRSILITGSTDGLGLAVAHRAAQAGDDVILHGRRQDRLDNAAGQIEEASGRRPASVLGDFASLAEVRSVAEQVSAITDKLDVLVNNAGIGTGEPEGRQRSESADGHELRFAVNYLAPFDLTLRLLPLVQAAPAGRIVNVASDGQAPLDFDNLMLTRDYSGEQAYCQSKLALIAFGMVLADKVDVTVNSLHPGSWMPTKIVIEDGAKVVDDLEGGIAAIYRLAVDPSVASTTGRYFVREVDTRALEPAYDPELRARLWETSYELTGNPNRV